MSKVFLDLTGDMALGMVGQFGKVTWIGHNRSSRIGDYRGLVAVVWDDTSPSWLQEADLWAVEYLVRVETKEA